MHHDYAQVQREFRKSNKQWAKMEKHMEKMNEKAHKEHDAM